MFPECRTETNESGCIAPLNVQCKYEYPGEQSRLGKIQIVLHYYSLILFF